jgi:hypothetical protein
VAQTLHRQSIRHFSLEEIARLKATYKHPSEAEMATREEKPYRGQTGAVVGGCEHVLDFETNQNREWEKAGLIIGGLDAHLCKLCSCWWVNLQMRANLLNKRSGFSESLRDNEK